MSSMEVEKSVLQDIIMCSIKLWSVVAVRDRYRGDMMCGGDLGAHDIL